ncbi:MAG: HD-GYP domain-containing protein [Acidimicrobiales bacterium]|nr:HD-GYP domain-containing protein [Acidimicrobiales bacterium]
MSAESPKTTATGGSARSQADGSGRWRASPTKAWAVRAFVFTAPLVAGYVAGFVAATLVPRPAGLLAAVGWWVAILAASTAAIWLSRPVMQQFAPLSFLYQCSLVFPDDAPSRYSVALRRSQARDLARRVEAGLPLGDTPQEAAENILAILADLNDHDRKTRGHSERVRAYSDLIAENMGLPDDDRSMLHWAALLHDVGKLTVPAEILNKNGRPTDEEWMTLREHPGAAGPILEPLRPWLGEWLDAATQHHERHDGDGYPLGLAGSDISLAGRIVAVADAYDVMTSARSYKKPWKPEDARRELASCAATQFDPKVVRAFLHISTARLQRISGPLSWLAQVPRLGELVGSATTAGSTAATVAGAAAAATVMAPLMVATYDTPQPAAAAQVEQTAPSTTSSAPDDTVVVDRTTTTALNPPTSQTTIGLPTTTTSVDATTSSSTTTEPIESLTAHPLDRSVIRLAPDQLVVGSGPDDITSDSSMFVIHESGPTTLSADLRVVGASSGRTVGVGSSADFTITSGSSICSYLIVAASPQRDRPIDAVIGSDDTILGFAVGAAEFTSPIEPGDSLTVDGQVVLVEFDATGTDRDQVRMFTACG